MAAGLSAGGEVGERGSEDGAANDEDGGTTLPPIPRPIDGRGGGVCTTACRWEEEGREDVPPVDAVSEVRMNMRDGPSLFGLPGREEESG